HAVRSEPDRLDDTANRSGFDKLAGSDCRAVFQPLAVHDRINAAGFGLDTPPLSELLQRRDAPVVGHEILSLFHYLDTQRGAVTWYGGADYELDRRVLEDFSLAASEPCLWEPLGESSSKVGFFGVERDKFTSAANHGFDLAVDVRVVDADSSKSDSW